MESSGVRQLERHRNGGGDRKGNRPCTGSQETLGTPGLDLASLDERG